MSGPQKINAAGHVEGRVNGRLNLVAELFMKRVEITRRMLIQDNQVGLQPMGMPEFVANSSSRRNAR